MIDRRSFLRSAALIATGVVAADQLEILERLTARRVFTTGGYGRFAGIPDGGQARTWNYGLMDVLQSQPLDWNTMQPTTHAEQARRMSTLAPKWAAA